MSETRSLRILLLPDLTNNWSAHNRAKAIAKFAIRHQFVIRAETDNVRQVSGVKTRIKLSRILRERTDRRPSPAIVEDHESFDVIHFNFSGGLTDYFDWILAHRHKCVLTAINERSYFDGFLVDQSKYRELLKACRSTSLSQRVAEASGATYIPNGIDVDLFSRHRSPVVGYAGTGSRNKNSHLIHQACEELGVGYRSALCAGMSASHSVPHDRMQDFYCGLDCYVHASSTEGFNNTILEALACNVPVLMTRQGCWQEFEGWVDFIEPTVESIKAGLRKFLGRRLVLDHFLWANIVPQYVRIYEDVHARTNHS